MSYDASRLRTSERIFSSNWERQGDEFVYTVKGSGFLHHMVRNLVGTFILVGKATLKAEDVHANTGSTQPLGRGSDCTRQRIVSGECGVLNLATNL
jgi:tRNA U38,U39,U40 pseudouridine synthase TruA